MNLEQFQQIVSKARTRQDKILEAKGRDYTAQNPDRLFNFKLIAYLTGMSPRAIWATYFMKHVLAVLNHSGGGKESEPITGRLDDVVNYIALYEALLEEEKQSIDSEEKK